MPRFTFAEHFKSQGTSHRNRFDEAHLDDIAEPVGAAVAIANIRLMQRENIVQKVRESTAPYLQQRLRELGDHPLVGEVRGVGMFGALELV